MMRALNIIASVVSLFLTGFLYAQDAAKTQSLIKELVTAKEDSVKARLFIQLGRGYRNSNPDSGIYYVSRGLELAEKIKDNALIAKAKCETGRFYYIKSNDSIALNYYNESLQLYEQLKDTGNMATLHMQKGYCYSRTNRDADMLAEFLLSLKLAEKTGNKERMSDALYSISDYYRQMNQDSIAVTYLFQSLNIDQQIGSKKNIASDYQYLGLCYGRLHKFKEGENYLSQAITIFKELKDDFRLATAYSYLGDLYSQMNDSNKCLLNFLRAKQIMDALGSKAESADLADNIAKVYLQKKDYNNAFKVAMNGLVAAKEVNAETQQYYLNSTLAEASAALLDYESAYRYMQNASILHDTLIAREEHDKLAQMQTQFESQRKEKENLLLKAQNETANANLQLNRIFLFAAMAGLLLLGGLLYMIYKNKEGKVKHIAILQNLNIQLNNQKEEITRINTMLRLKALRVQMNPHFIFNCMSSIQECILLGQVDDANKYLSKLSKLLRMVLFHAEEESISLDKELEMLELYLELESARLKQNFHYTIQVDETIFPNEIMVPTLILQPFAENAIWHGLLHKENNRILHIKISCINDWLHCIVEDNGVGRQKAAAMQQLKKHHQSKGLKITAERLNIIKEQTNSPQTGFEITDLFNEANEPGGTSVLIKLPLDV